MSENGKEQISIIIPVYNVEQYLEQCICSVLGQSYSNLEILLIDDGSTDHSPEICDRYEKKDSRITVIHQKNGGLSAARNRGLDQARGDLIYFLDSDDRIPGQAIQILYENMRKTGADISIGGINHVKEGENLTESDYRGQVSCFSSREALEHIYVNSYQESMVVAWGKLYRKRLWEHLRFPEGRYHEDEYVAHYLLGSARQVVYTDEKLYDYLMRTSSITGKRYDLYRLDAGEALQDRIRYFKEKGYKDLTVRAEEVYLWWLMDNYCKVRHYKKSEKEVQKKLLEEFERYYRGRKIKKIGKRINCYLFYHAPNMVAWVHGIMMKG
jgi:glycosyltransferase involved in cell wall biosynthesis